MLLRIEALGRILHIEYTKPEPDEPTEREYVPTPMVVQTPPYVGFVTIEPDCQTLPDED